MAGLVYRGYGSNVSTNTGFITKTLKELSRLGMKFDDQVIKNSKTIGLKEENKGLYNSQSFSSEEDIYNAFASMTMSDSTLKDSIAYFDRTYEQKREELKNLSLNNELDSILNILSNECIHSNESNAIACLPIYNGDIKPELKDELTTVFKKIYNYYGFFDGFSLWEYFKKWLIEGYIAFEIIYDNTQKNIIGFKELDPITLKPSVIQDESGKIKKIFYQYYGQSNQRILYDSQVIYISYSGMTSKSKVSYLDRLVRPFNMLRIMEQTRYIWAVTNATFRMKYIIPVGGKSKTRAKESLSKLMNSYNEDIKFDVSSGEIRINGKPDLSFMKQIWLPEKDGSSPTVEPMGGDGPDLNDTEALKYFGFKLRDETEIPYNRFDKENPTGYELAAEGMMRDEIRFSKFISRLRARFKQILLKPLYIQMVLKHPELENDENFKINLNLQFTKENVFDELKNYELSQKRIDIISSLKDSLITQDADLNDIQYFDLNFLIEKILVEKFIEFTPEDLKTNYKYKQITAIEKEGYLRPDAERIFNGEKRKKFKKIKLASTVTEEIPTDEELGATEEEIPTE